MSSQPCSTAISIEPAQREEDAIRTEAMAVAAAVRSDFEADQMTVNAEVRFRHLGFTSDWAAEPLTAA